MEETKKLQRFSYSKVDTFKQCGWKYKLVYEDGNFISKGSIATEFGTLIHYIEETMAHTIISFERLDYDKLIDLLLTVNIESDKEKVYGANILRNKYAKEWFELDKNGKNYEDKLNEYINTGIYRLRDYLIANPDFEILAIEQEFDLTIDNYIFHGFIDRAFRNVVTGEIFLEDIKTWTKDLDKDVLTTPMQLAIYSLAAQELYNTDLDKIHCFYELPLWNKRYSAGTKGFVNRSLKKIKTLLEDIANEKFEPNPSPLCHWCDFCHTNPNQPEEGKNLCPYFSKWTRESKDFSVEYEWLGIENHDRILEAFINKNSKPLKSNITIQKNSSKLDVNNSDSNIRVYIFR